ncbi:MAG: hypothetical protein ACI815_000265 [Psychroserpens sp.]|jgi:hypothetical protein
MNIFCPYHIGIIPYMLVGHASPVPIPINRLILLGDNNDYYILGEHYYNSLTQIFL